MANGRESSQSPAKDLNGLRRVFGRSKCASRVIEFLGLQEALKLAQLSEFFRKETLGNRRFLPQLAHEMKTRGVFWKLSEGQLLEAARNSIEDRYFEEKKLDLFLRRFLLYDYNPHNVKMTQWLIHSDAFGNDEKRHQQAGGRSG